MKKIIIVGAGPAGVLAAIKLSKKFDVTLLEKNSEILKKLLLTGSGRCNYYNDDMSISHFYTESKKDITSFINDNKKVLDFFNDIGVIPVIKNGYYYPYSNSAYSVFNSLKRELIKNNVNIITDYEVKNIKKIDEKFIINDELKCDKLILSLGGKSYPKTGSVGDGFNFLNEMNLNTVTPLPALISLKSDSKYQKKWSGIKANAKLSLYENGKLLKEEAGELLLTDYGISGICTFNLSTIVSRGLFNNKKEEVVINFVDFLSLKTKADFINYLDNRDNELKTDHVYELFDGFMNYKLVNILLGNYKDKKWNKLKRNDKDIIASLFYEFKLDIIDTGSFDKAQVTSGGLSLDEINLDTFEVNKIKNLYVIGEMLDLNGECGGYNLTICFLSGLKVGENID